MRTTITLDADVADRLTDLQRDRGLSFKDAINETLRRGLAGIGAGQKVSPYRMPVRDLGLRSDIDIDRIRDELSAQDDQRFLGTDA